MNRFIKCFVTLILLTAGMDYSFAQQKEVSATSFSFYKNNRVLKINYFGSHSPDQKNKEINRLVIVVHGTNRNPGTYYESMAAAAKKKNAENKTLIISPGFIMETDLEANRDLLTDDHIFWTNSGWKQGDASVTNSKKNLRTGQMSSFEAMDSMIMQILSSGNYPNIRSIVLAGNSAGGQYMNRYCASSPIHDLVMKNYGIEIKYLVAAPSSYTYLTYERIVEGSDATFAVPENPKCADYDHYRYGLEKLNEYLSVKGADAIKKDYGQRRIAYFCGAEDNDPKHSQLDVTCSAMLQGKERLDRAMIIQKYLSHVYGKNIKKRQALTIVENSGHDNYKMFNSPNGVRWLFTDKKRPKSNYQ